MHESELKYIDMRKEFDIVIVGAGLFGATVARICHDRGLRCLVLERRENAGGNCRDERMEGINVHLFGPHIFHTSSVEVWNFANRFTSFNHFRYSPLALYRGSLYSLPFNMNTFHQIYGVTTPAEAMQALINEQRAEYVEKPENLEEKAVSMVGRKIYETLIKGYTEKQWGRCCRDLPPDIISRLPVRMTFDNNYFNDPYQGIPEKGYSGWISALLKGMEVRTHVDFNIDREYWKDKAGQVVYTGAIDEYFGYMFGELEYRSLNWKHKLYDTPNRQGVAVINHTDEDVPFTRTIEHKHFEFGTQSLTIVSEEYPRDWHKGVEPFYPVNNETNNKLYENYREFARIREPDVIFGGRLGLYRYLDMDKTILEAMKVAGNIIMKASV